MSNPRIPLSLLKDPRCFLAFGFGSGCASKAPGTFGTLAAVPLYLLMSGLSWEFYLTICIVAFLLGCYLCTVASKALNVHDHGGIVWDEFVGYWVAMFMVPNTWEWILFGFALFRLFDIWKPFPIKALDAKVHGGIGIMLDDVVAGIYALAVIQLAIAFT